MNEISTLTERRVLIVDDESDLRAIFGDLLTEMGILYDEAGDGVEALYRIKVQDYDAILSDIKMPNMNGIDLMANLKKLSCETPLVVLTGCSELEMVREAMRLGAVDFLDKPCSAEELKSVLFRAIEIGVRRKRIQSEITKNAELAKKVEFESKMINLLELKNSAERRKLG
jgi:DNA-binding NtrC family response regulator